MFAIIGEDAVELLEAFGRAMNRVPSMPEILFVQACKTVNIHACDRSILLIRDPHSVTHANYLTRIILSTYEHKGMLCVYVCIYVI